MNRLAFLRLLKIQTFIIVLVMSLLSIKSYSANSNLQNTPLPDSIQTLIKECNTDNCTFVVISNIINKHGMYDFKSYEYYTKLLYAKLKNCSSPYIQYVRHQNMAKVHKYNADYNAAEKELKIAYKNIIDLISHTNTL